MLNVFSVGFKQDGQRSPTTSCRAPVLGVQCLTPSASESAKAGLRSVLRRAGGWGKSRPAALPGVMEDRLEERFIIVFPERASSHCSFINVFKL